MTYSIFLPNSSINISMESTSSPPVLLSAYTVTTWKKYIFIQALKLNGLGILDGSEPEPSPGADAKLIASYAERRSNLAGTIFETPDDSQIAVLLDNIASLNVANTYRKLL